MSKASSRKNTLIWYPNISYSGNSGCDDGTCVEPYSITSDPQSVQATLITNYNMAYDHRLAGTPPLPFVSSSADTLPNFFTPTQTFVNVTGRVRKLGSTGDAVKSRSCASAAPRPPSCGRRMRFR